MPPVRRSHRAAAPPPYTAEGWLSRCCRPGRRQRRADDDVDPLANLPDDLLFGIFSRVFSDSAAAVACCAAAHARWARVVAARAAAISHALPPPGRFLPHLALGFFHWEKDDGSRRRRQLVASQRQPRLVPTTSASLLLGPPPFAALQEASSSNSLLDYARPVASRNGCVVLELRREARTDGLALCVCNPMTGDHAVLQPLTGDDCPGHDYACCVLLAGEDHDAPPQSPAGFSFRLLLVYNRRTFTALRSYSSDAGTWGPQGRKPGSKIGGHTLRRLGPAVVLRGVAYWTMDNAALGVRLDGLDDDDACSVVVVPYSLRHMSPEWRLLGVTPDGMLSYVSAAVSGGALSFQVETLDVQSVADDMSTAADRWERREFIRLPEMKVSVTTELKLRWLGEKSGALFFTIGEGGDSTSGAFALNLGTGCVEKLADGVECNSWRNLCGYEMDRAALLESVVARFF